MSFDHQGLGDESRRIAARLIAIIEARKAMLRVDPIPALEKAGEVIAKQQHLIHQIYDALNHTDHVFEMAERYDRPPEMVNGVEMERNNKAREMLNEYYGK